MKKIILSLCCVLCSSLLNINAGVESTTLVHTPQGLKHINALAIGDEIICYSKELEKETRTVTAIKSYHYESCIEVTMADNEVMRFSHDQRVFTPFKWIPVECLSIGDALMNEQKQFVRIASIAHKEEPIDLYFIEVDEYANYMISESGLLVHNGIIGANIGMFVGGSLVAGTYGAITAGVGAVTGGAGVAVWTYWTAGPALALTKAATIAGGIVGGTITGPA